MDLDILKREEAKRERCYDPQQRWSAIQRAIEFADAQQPVSRNSKEKCLELQEKKRIESASPGEPVS
jgi:hypothetical protein